MKKITLYSLLIIITAVGCSEDNLDVPDVADLDSFEEMELAWDKAQLYNDSLVYCHEATIPCPQSYLEYCDSLFHNYVNEWNHHHGDYSHNDDYSDHHHDGHGMHHHGPNNNPNNDDGHHEFHHNMMDSLMWHHGPYHP